MARSAKYVIDRSERARCKAARSLPALTLPRMIFHSNPFGPFGSVEVRDAID